MDLPVQALRVGELDVTPNGDMHIINGENGLVLISLLNSELEVASVIVSFKDSSTETTSYMTLESRYEFASLNKKTILDIITEKLVNFDMCALDMGIYYIYEGKQFMGTTDITGDFND